MIYLAIKECTHLLCGKTDVIQVDNKTPIAYIVVTIICHMHFIFWLFIVDPAWSPSCISILVSFIITSCPFLFTLFSCTAYIKPYQVINEVAVALIVFIWVLQLVNPTHLSRLTHVHCVRPHGRLSAFAVVFCDRLFTATADCVLSALHPWLLQT